MNSPCAHTQLGRIVTKAVAVQDETAHNPIDLGMLKRIQAKESNNTKRAEGTVQKTCGMASLNAWLYIMLWGLAHAFDRPGGKKKMVANSGDVALFMLLSAMEGCRCVLWQPTHHKHTLIHTLSTHVCRTMHTCTPSRRAGEVMNIKAANLWFHLPGDEFKDNTEWQEMHKKLTKQTANKSLRGRIPWLALVFLPAPLLARVLAAITSYSLTVDRCKDKGNSNADPFTTTRVAMPAPYTIIDPLHIYVIMTRLQLANQRPLSRWVFPRKTDGKHEEVATVIKVIGERALGVPCWLAG